MLTIEDIAKFKTLYKKHYKYELKDKEALESATQFINLFKAVYKPIPIKLTKNYNETKTTNNHTN